MIIAEVLGPIWSSKRLEHFPAGALLQVEQRHTGHHFVALDTLGSGVGDQVLLAQGAAVANHLPGSPPIDALIVGVIDNTTK